MDRDSLGSGLDEEAAPGVLVEERPLSMRLPQEAVITGSRMKQGAVFRVGEHRIPAEESRRWDPLFSKAGPLPGDLEGSCPRSLEEGERDGVAPVRQHDAAGLFLRTVQSVVADNERLAYPEYAAPAILTIYICSAFLVLNPLVEFLSDRFCGAVTRFRGKSPFALHFD